MVKLSHALAACSVVALPSQAIATCWTPQSIAAAELRALETMLMVSALRCRLDGYDFTPEYNRFVRFNRATLMQAGEDLRLHFDRGDGHRSQLDRYDDYVTRIANGHGERGAYSCDDLRLITEDGISAEGSRPALLRLARAIGVQPPQFNRMCRAGESNARWAAADDRDDGLVDGVPLAVAAPIARAATAPAAIAVAAAVPVPVAPEPVAVAASAPIDGLPTIAVADAPIAEPQPVALETASVPALQPAVATDVAEAPVVGELTGSGDLEIEVVEGPVTNGVRTKTYRIRLAD